MSRFFSASPCLRGAVRAWRCIARAPTSSGQNPTTNARDDVFSDGVTNQLVTLAGDVATGYAGTFQVGVAL